MGYPTKVQLIQRDASKQWYVNFPSALAQAMEFAKSEVVEWIIKDKDTLVLQRKARKVGQRKKKTVALLPHFNALWDECMDVFSQQRTWQRARRLSLSQLACLGRHTMTGLLCTGGRQFADWSADYRLFSQDQWNAQQLFTPVTRGVLAQVTQLW